MDIVFHQTTLVYFKSISKLTLYISAPTNDQTDSDIVIIVIRHSHHSHQTWSSDMVIRHSHHSHQT